MSGPDAVYELRRYRLKPGSREGLIALFEREFIETQEVEGMTLNGTYRDLDDPDAFVWFRSFPDMEQRARALAAFYGGPTWQAWGSAANATMINSDNVLLLRPVGAVFPPSAGHANDGPVAISTCSLAPGREDDFARRWRSDVQPMLESVGARIDAAFVSEKSANSFPQLPVREGDTVFVWVSAFRDDASYQAHLAELGALPDWTEKALPWLDRQIWRPVETLRLRPTARSNHRW